jgi:ribose transport system ATP-binding protein
MQTMIETRAVAPILRMQGVHKSFPGVQALRGVDLDVYPGEIHGLVGKNGAGKSTLVRVLMGLHEPDAGTLELDGHRFAHITANEALRAGVTYVPQHVSMMDSLTVAENMLAGRLPKGFLGLVDWKATYAEAEMRLKKLGLRLDVHKPVEGLTVAEQTMLAIAKALFSNAKLIILDEPTASLPRSDINRLFEFVRALEKKGVAFIYISHHLEEVFEICDRVTIMRDGALVGTYQVAELDMHELVNLITSEEIEEYTRKTTCQRGRRVLEIAGLTRRAHYEDIHLTVDRGEVVGLTGLQGCGAEALAMGLFGLESCGIGSVCVNGKPYAARGPNEALELGLALLPEDRPRYGIVGPRPVRENISYTVINQLLTLIGIVRLRDERLLVNGYIRGLGIVTPGEEQPVRLLSGGNQQKVVFAKLAAAKPTLLILHEPTFGIDVRAKLDIFRIIHELATEGVGVLIVSSEVRELIGLSDRIVVMYGGRITSEFNRGDVATTPENILRAIEGGNGNGKR